MGTLAAGACDLHAVAAAIAERRRSVPRRRAVLAALTGIDGCGKGFVAAQLAALLRAPGPGSAGRGRGPGLRVAVVGIDGWLNLPPARFDPRNPAGHFYEHAIRFDEMFERLVCPLRDRRSLRLEADWVDETATAYRRHVYDFRDVDVILLEGIFLLKRAQRARGLYDLSVWIECSFETALERAVGRAQEGLGPQETARAYGTIYFPAQRIHFERDDPRSAASVVLVNDPRIAMAVPG